MTYRKVLLLSLFTIIYTFTFAQSKEKCGTVPYNKKIYSKVSLSEKDFEKWLQNKIVSHNQKLATSRTNEAVYTIPIVFHVIHNGEEVGIGANIPLTQIQEQIRIINEDYRKKNADTSKTPATFKSIAADTYIEFKLALQDPDGAPTDGVVRVNGKRTGWVFEDGDELKKVSYWPSDKYLNVWVANMTDNTIGFSQFPTSAVLAGLEEGSDIGETDGVVVDYKELGRGGNANKRSRGRTLTHEVGHFLGLKHIWGDDDGGCSGEDYVTDTPNQGNSHNTCPGYPSASCGNSSDMFMNYMDYTPDTCMNIFTNGQKTRMRTILENSPRRMSLLTSIGLVAPTIYARDVAITKVLNPGPTLCETTVAPSFILRNIGTAKLTSISIDYTINGQTSSSTKQVNVASYDTTKIVLPQVSVGSVPGDYILTIELKSPNGSTDERTTNNILTQSFKIFPSATLPYTEKFDNLNTFSADNTSNATVWQIADVGGNGTSNKAAKISFLNTAQIGDRDYLISPTFSTKGLDSLSLSFKYSYAAKDNFSEDILAIRVSADCGMSFYQQDEVYFNTSSFLETTTATTSPFVPSKPEHWRTECLNLSNYIGFDKLQIEFIAISGEGNALYIDDVELKYTTCNGGIPVAVDKEVEKPEFNLYPNPGPGNLTVELKLPAAEDLELVVFDALGRIVFQDNYTKANSLHEDLNLSGFTAGLYFIKIHGKTINLDRKVIIRK
jgi:hypothetical protein